MAPPLAALGDLDASQAAADHSLAMALRVGDPVSIGTSVVAAAGALVYNHDPPDFAGALDLLHRNAHHHRLADDNMTGVWLELMRGLSLVGSQQQSAVLLLARCLRTADRLQAFPAVELAVHLLVLDTASAGEHEIAATLVGYLDANLARYRTQAAALGWLDRRIHNALGALTTEERDHHYARGAGLTRRELMSLVASLESTMALQA